MKRGWRVPTIVLLALVLLSLAACGSAPTDAGEGNREGLWSRIKGFFTDVTDRLASAPVIGAWFTTLKGRMAPENQWCIGGGLGALSLVVLLAVFFSVRD